MINKFLGLCALIVLCGVFASSALAGEKSRAVTFGKDFMVGTTLVKSGTYKIVYNDQTNELSFVDRKTKAVVAKVMATTKDVANSSNAIDFGWEDKEGNKALISITFPGDHKAIVLNGMPSSSGS